MDDQRNPEWKVVVTHLPRQTRIIGYRESLFNGEDFALETPIPDESTPGYVSRGSPQEIP